MSLDTKERIWLELARTKYPTLSEDRLRALSLEAASDWYLEQDNDLTKLFDQYVMIKNLKGL